MDLQDKEDLVEEIGRLYGFDKLPKVLPERNLRPVAKNQTGSCAFNPRKFEVPALTKY